MQPRNLALVGAALGAGFGAVGLIVPESLASLFGIQLDATATALVRLACASYVGFGALNWAARDLTDGEAWRVVAVGNATSWAISGAVAAIALASGLGNSVAWVVVALQFVMTIAWLGVFARSRRSGRDTSSLGVRDARP
jgi:uncharacterized ion transporter superfamily protein YfcC